MKYASTIAAAASVFIIGFGVATPIGTAQTAPLISASISSELPSGAFVKKKKKLKGSWEIVQRGEKTFIVFGDDYKAAKGPDLKIFLSPQTVSDVKSKTAMDGALKVAELKSIKGGQEYELPANVNLDDYSSVLIHCEAYTVLWGGSDL